MLSSSTRLYIFNYKRIYLRFLIFQYYGEEETEDDLQNKYHYNESRQHQRRYQSNIKRYGKYNQIN